MGRRRGRGGRRGWVQRTVAVLVDGDEVDVVRDGEAVRWRMLELNLLDLDRVRRHGGLVGLGRRCARAGVLHTVLLQSPLQGELDASALPQRGRSDLEPMSFVSQS